MRRIVAQRNGALQLNRCAVSRPPEGELVAWGGPARRERAAGAALSTDRCVQSERVVHVELDRMGRHAEARDFLRLQLDVGVEERVGEDAALREERTVLVEVVERLVEAVADGRD